MSTKREYELVFKSRFEEWDREIDEIMHKIDHADPDTKEYLNGQLEKIHALKQEAREHMDKLTDADESAWEHLKDDIEHIWHRVEEAFAPTRD